MGTANAILKSALFPFLGCLGTILLGWYTDKYAKNGDRARATWIMLSGLIFSLLAVVWCIQAISVAQLLFGVPVRFRISLVGAKYFRYLL